MLKNYEMFVIQQPTLPNSFINYDRLVNNELVKVKAYYKNVFMTDDYTSLIYRILSFAPSKKIEFLTYAMIVNDLVDKIKRNTNIVSEQPHKVDIDSKDLYISVDSDIDLFNYKILKPLRPIYTDYTSLYIHHPYQIDSSIIYLLDIKRLLLNWYHSDLDKLKFVYKLYTDTIEDFKNLAMINIFLGKTINKLSNPHKIQIINYDRQIRKIAKKYNISSKRNKISILGYFQSLPYKESIQFKMPFLTEYNINQYIMLYLLYFSQIKRNTKLVDSTIKSDLLFMKNFINTYKYIEFNCNIFDITPTKNIVKEYIWTL
jgi:hypothetical protein